MSPSLRAGMTSTTDGVGASAATGYAAVSLRPNVSRWAGLIAITVHAMASTPRKMRVAIAMQRSSGPTGHCCAGQHANRDEDAAVSLALRLPRVFHAPTDSMRN